LTYSSSFDNAAWLLLNATISANTITSPSGIQDADSIIENTATGIHIFYQGPIAASSGIYTTSMFFKKNTRQYAFLQIAVNGAADRFTAVIDLNNGNVTDTTTVGSPTSTSYTTEDFGNGWYRLTVSAQHNSGNVFLVSGLSDSATPTYNVTGEPSYTGNGTGSVYSWGAQLEAGAYATSYIPTTSASVTRNADVISKTGISSLIGQTEGTIFCELDRIEGAENMGIWMRTGLTSYNEMITILINPDGTSVASVRSSATQQFFAASTALSSGKHKFALTYKANDFAFYIDGVQISTSTSGTPPTCDEIYLGGYPDGGTRASKNVATALWQTRLDNATLASLTTL
jgi:hypothetical protein